MFKPSLTERVRMRTAPSVSKRTVFDLHFFWSCVHAIDNDTLSYVFSMDYTQNTMGHVIGVI